MLKFLIILILLCYLIYRIGGFFFKILFSGSEQQHHYRNQQRTRNPANGNVRVDYVPEKDKKERKEFNGGQYVDYEEVK